MMSVQHRPLLDNDVPVLPHATTALSIPLHRDKGAGVYQPEPYAAVHNGTHLLQVAPATAARIGAPRRE